MNGTSNEAIFCFKRFILVQDNKFNDTVLPGNWLYHYNGCTFCLAGGCFQIDPILRVRFDENIDTENPIDMLNFAINYCIENSDDILILLFLKDMSMMGTNLLVMNLNKQLLKQKHFLYGGMVRS